MHGTEHIDQSIDIERALQGLTSKQREAVSLILDGHSRADVARLRCVSKSTITGLLKSAVKNLTISLVIG